FEHITEQIISECFVPAGTPGQFIYNQKISKARKCQIVFEKEFSGGLAIHKQKEKFIEKLLEYYPEDFKNDSPRSIISNLTRDESEIILWRVGFFKHISAVSPKVNEKTLLPIKKWLESKLDEGISQISANAAFDVFSTELNHLEIDTEHALFSLLK